MNAEQRERRQAAAGRHDAALAKWPDRNGPEFERELNDVIRVLTALCDELSLKRIADVDRITTLRWLGSAYFDLARSQDQTLLRKSLEVYREAQVVADKVNDVAESAKLSFNTANTLQALAGGKNRGMLEEAVGRYEEAIEYFDGTHPEHATASRQVLQIVRTQLGILGLVDQASAGLEELKEIERTLKGDSGETPETEREAKRRLRDFTQRVKAPQELGREAGKLVESLAMTTSSGGQRTADQEAGIAKLRELLSEAASKADGSGTDPKMRMFVGMLRQRYRMEAAAGKVDPVRQRALERILDELDRLVDRPATDLADIGHVLDVLQELMARQGPLAVNASFGRPDPPGRSRAAAIRERQKELQRFLVAELMRRGQGSSERRKIGEIYQRAAEGESNLLVFAKDETKVVSLEREVLRPLALDAHTFALRHHIMIADPIWSSPSVFRDPNGLFLTGSLPLSKSLQEQQRRLGLVVKSEARAKSAEQGTWDDLRASNVAVFDFTVPTGPDLAAVCYQLGVSRAIGTRCVIVATSRNQVPFDVEIEPTIISRTPTEGAVLSDALDDALYSARRLEGDSSVAATIEYARRRFEPLQRRAEIEQSLRMLDDIDDDPIEARGILEQLIGFTGPGKPVVLLPAWPGRYPEPNVRRCFHVTPYQPTWVKQVEDLAERACKTAKTEYLIGHRGSEARIIRSIWDDICRSTHVLVDLTGFTPNASIEMGMAHALGKPTLIIAQGDEVKKLPPQLEKIRIHQYSLADSTRLENLIRNFTST